MNSTEPISTGNVTARLSSEDVAFLKARAQAEDRSVSAVLRRLIRQEREARSDRDN